MSKIELLKKRSEFSNRLGSGYTSDIKSPEKLRQEVKRAYEAKSTSKSCVNTAAGRNEY